MVNREIIELVGCIVILGAAYLMANGREKKIIELKAKHNSLYRNYKNANDHRNKMTKEIKILKIEKQELLQKSAKVIQEKDHEILKLTEFKKELIEIHEFDNELLTKRTKQIERRDEFIDKLDKENCEFKIKIFNLEQEKSLMIKKVTGRKVLKAARLGGVAR